MERLHHHDRLTVTATKSVVASASIAWELATAAALAEAGGALLRLDPPAPVGRPGAGHSHVSIVAGDGPAPRADGYRAGQADIRSDSWQRHGATITTDADALVSALIVAEVLCADPDAIDEWDEWYDRVHLPDMMACGAFVGGTRWRRPTPRAGSANHLTVYEIAGLDVTDAVERSAAIMPDLVRRGRKLDSHAGGLTMSLTCV